MRASLRECTGRTVEFEDIEDFRGRIDDDALDVDEHCVLVLKNCGPKGYPGMAEVGNMPLPPKVLRKGITDMVRISDARKSGTAYGTVVLHTAPEAAAGGPLALVQNGEEITLDVAGRRLHLHVSDEELAKRRASWTPPKPTLESGFWKLYTDTVLQADKGADLDLPLRPFVLRTCRRPRSGDGNTRSSIHAGTGCPYCRVIADIEDSVLRVLVVGVGNRKDVYR